MGGDSFFSDGFGGGPWGVVGPWGPDGLWGPDGPWGPGGPWGPLAFFGGPRADFAFSLGEDPQQPIDDASVPTKCVYNTDTGVW